MSSQVEKSMKLREEKDIDKQYNIDTCGRDASSEDSEHHAYEPTPYDVLRLIADSGFINETDILVDMGSGKGRVAVYLSKETGCKTKGIEYDDRLCMKASDNLKNAQQITNADIDVEFLNVAAEKYQIAAEDSVFFFFNPFSEKILETVLSNIAKSFYDCEREIKLIFYYPSLEYVGRLMTTDYLEFVDEIDCSHLYKDTKGRECVMIFRVV